MINNIIHKILSYVLTNVLIAHNEAGDSAYVIPNYDGLI